VRNKKGTSRTVSSNPSSIASQIPAILSAPVLRSCPENAAFLFCSDIEYNIPVKKKGHVRFRHMALVTKQKAISAQVLRQADTSL
jgi:hypothetical protein